MKKEREERMNGWKLLRLPVGSALAVLLLVTVAACGGQEDVPEPAETPELVARTDAASTTVVVDGMVRQSPTPYLRSVPAPLVVTATSFPAATFESASADSPTIATPVAIESPTVNGFIAPTVVVATTPTSTAVKTPTVQPFPTQAPTTVEKKSGEWPTPQELGAVEWRKFEESGYFTKTVSKGKTISVYEDPTENREVTCGPEVGTAFDSSNPTWSDASHLIYVWSVIEGWGAGNCRGVSKYEDWINKPLPAAPLSQKESQERRIAAGERLKFAVDDSDRDYSMHPGYYGETYPRIKVIERNGVWGAETWQGGVLWEGTLEDGWVANCGHRSFPWAIWRKDSGFYTISIEDEEAAYGEEWTDEEISMKEEARSRGWYFIYMSSLNPHRNFCWHVPNHEEIPPHRPCLECHWRGQ